MFLLLRVELICKGTVHGTDTATASLDARLIITTTDTAMGLARKMKIEGNAFDVDDFLIRYVCLDFLV